MSRSRALIVIDMFNPYEHDDADVLAANVEAIIEPLAALIDHAHRAGGELVYVNDNYGDFAATRDDLVARASEGRRPDLVEPIVPREGTAFLPKVRHSASTARRSSTSCGSAASRRSSWWAR